MQKPPDQSRPVYYLDEAVDITADAPEHMITVPRTSSTMMSGAFGRSVPTYYQNQNAVKATTKRLEQEYQAKASYLPHSIEAELAATRHEGPTDPVPPLQSVVRELGVLNKLTQRKTAEFHSKTATANMFYGGDPFNRHINEFMIKATKMEKWPGPNGIAMQALNQSLRAAINARLLSQTIQSLNQRTVNAQNLLRVVQANEEAQRAAAELARINEEAAVRAREQARLAAMENARRAAAEQARVAAEAAAQQVAAERARLEEQAEIKRETEKAREAQEAKEAKEAKEREEVKAKKRAEGLARLNAMVAMFDSLEAAETSRPFPISGSAVAVGPVFTLATGRLATSTATTRAVRAAQQAGVAAIIRAGTAAATPVIVGFAALLFPSPLGNGDRRQLSVPLSDLAPDNLHAWNLSLLDYEPDGLHALSVPLSDLTPDGIEDLYAIAEANGEVRLPVAIGTRTVGNTTEYFVAATNGTTVPSRVPVRLATLDPSLNIYRTYNPNTPSIGMTWTPTVRPDNASTSLPAKELNVVVYNGTTVTALEGRIDSFPELDLYSFGGFINVFPIESGIPAQYVVFNTPYEGAIVEGEHSGRDFNPEQTGGPTLDMKWEPAIASQEGANIVKLHTSKFHPSDANKVMIDRLDRILRGELEMNDTDRRFYTHEIREFERFKALGYGDTEMPDPDSPVWNNVHTATLEDFKLKDDPSLLYTPEALAAAAEQDERDYQRFLKEMWK
ncbi:S-type pyocin domain-containing protein [Pseudomonas fluorescens]|uniref:Pyosin/cloacin translocation domain-containing protein n=1 Tax=Pseudomonas fluorescens TaxID=294 RepID=A0A0F4VGA8_PSEFL|nr:S-type pyocin domain-containing protein [Pseudomonas fluorescens]KJZ67022.1 hypothetical protein VD17_04965 [Pseudomonas fluorescens]